MLYFAYGSNLYFPQMKKRCPSAKFVMLDSLSGYKVVFSKKSADGTGKATLIAQKDSVVYGALYSISEKDYETLDGYEGLGEHYHRFEMITDEFIHCQVYVAAPHQIDNTLLPGTKYQDIIVKGLKKREAPEEYIKSIADLTSKLEQVIFIPPYKEDGMFEIYMPPDPVKQQKATKYREYLDKKSKLRKNKSCVNT